MGTPHPHRDATAAALFGETRRAVLETLFARSDDPLYVREIIRRSGVGQGAVQRELKRLHEAGLIVREERGNQVYYAPDPTSPMHDVLDALMHETAGVAAPVPTEEEPRDPDALGVGARETADRHELLPPGAPVLVLVSGGADSTALLCALAAGELGDHPLRVLHVDHALREDAADDARWVAALCEGLGVECRVVREDVAALSAAEGLNVEDAGRRARYRLADEEADALAADLGLAPTAVRIAVAHTRDDLVETVLMRLAQGSGHGALAGIRPRRGRIVRPLLGARRADVLAYLGARGQAWREDHTNADTSRLRARVRHELVPAFEAINPGFVDALARTAGLVADDDGILQEMADAFARDFSVDGGEDLVFDVTLLSTLTRPMARRVLRTALVERFPEASRIEAVHVEALVDALGREEFARDITGGLRVRIECAKMVVSRGGGFEAPIDDVKLEVPGTADLGRAGWIVAELVGPNEPARDSHEAWLDADTVVGELLVGSPREGERMRPLGMEGTKKLSDVLTDAKVPARMRQRTPVVRDGEAVVWVAGVRVSEDRKVTPGTERVLRLVWHEE